jgi:hypothetical protein
MKTYLGHTIERIWHSGIYSAFVEGHGFLKADTLAGIKELIRATK